MNKLIENITIHHYRGFKDPHTMELAEFGKITFLVGPNNSGKSLLARIFCIFDVNIHQNNSNFFSVPFTDKDFYGFNVEEPITLKFTLDTYLLNLSQDPDILRVAPLGQLIFCCVIRKINGHFSSCLYLNYMNTDSHFFNSDNARYDYNEDFSSKFISGDINKDRTERICLKLFSELKSRVLIFDSIRSFDRTSYSPFFKSGAELINWLDENKNPSETAKVRSSLSSWLKHQFNLDLPVAITVDKGKKQLMFTFENHLELSSQEVGTGYTMLCILLMEIARGKKNIVIIDELESHLQPGLVRVLVKILRENIQSQYIIATHSPTAIETSSSNDFLYRFTKFEGKCTFEGFFRDKNSGRNAKILREVANELGVIPGDALLSNTVIWVEGPSEIFWVRAWLRAYFEKYKKQHQIQKNIIEGLHYTILMTGGNNLAHYSYTENEIELADLDIEDKLNILRVNPNPFVIIDSDNTNIGSEKYKRMQRIAIELKEQNKLHPLFKVSTEDANFDIKKIPNLWVLEGRELENYAHPQLLSQFYTNLQASSKVSGITESTNWDVFSVEKGVGQLLKEQGVMNVSEASGTIKHKSQLAKYIFTHFKEDHFEFESTSKKANSSMIEDLTGNLDKLIEYILKVNMIY